MLPENIDRFIDRLCALYPGTQVARNTIKAGWRVDKELLGASVESCRRVIPTVEKDGQFPSLFRVKQILKQIKPNELIEKCLLCHGTGWDDGSNTAEGRYTRQSELGRVYTYVKPCSCRDGAIDETTMAMQSL